MSLRVAALLLAIATPIGAWWALRPPPPPRSTLDAPLHRPMITPAASRRAEVPEPIPVDLAAAAPVS